MVHMCCLIRFRVLTKLLVREFPNVCVFGVYRNCMVCVLNVGVVLSVLCVA